MKITAEESRILKFIFEDAESNVKRGRKASDYDQTREQRLLLWNKVGNLINRYENWLKQN